MIDKGYDLAVADEGSSEIEADNGGKKVGIQRSDDDAWDLDPLNFGDGGCEEEEAGREFWVADEDRDGWRDESDDFGEGNDEEDTCQSDEPTSPLEAFIVILTGFIDNSGIGF